MNIEVRKLSEIQPYASNPRRNDRAVEAVARSLKEFGFRQPIVVDEQGVIVVGHTRYKAALKLGFEKVPVHVAGDLSAEQLKAYRLADNKTHELAEWDDELLAQELAELASLEFDLELLGFEDQELTELLGGDINAGLCDADQIPEPPDEPITAPGDLWQLGPHRLLCGDSAHPDDVNRLLDGRSIQLVNTDPPYNVKLEPRSNNAIAAGRQRPSRPSDAGPHQRLDLARQPGKAKATHRKLRAKDRPLENDFVSDDQFQRLLAAWVGQVARVLEPGRSF